MGPIKFAYKMLKLEYKKTFFYAFTLIVTVAVVFAFLNLANNIYLGNNMYASPEVDLTRVSISFSSLLSIAMITMSVLAACFSNSVYLSKKVNEIAIYQISGGNIVEVASYLIGQNFIVGGIAIPVGIVFGYLLNGAINMYVYSDLGIVGNIWYVSGETVTLLIFYILTVLMAMTIIDTGFVYRNDILTLLNMDKSIKPAKPSTGIRMPIIVYWILYFLPFYFFITKQGDEPKTYAVYSMVGILGILGLYSRGIPKVLEKLQSTRNLSKPKQLIVIGNLKYSVAKTKSLVFIIIFSIIALMCYSMGYIGMPKDYSIMYISYIVTIILVTLMILYKIMLENDSHAHIYSSLMKLGYTPSQILAILRREVFLYYGLLLFFISAYAIPILGHFVNNETITLMYAIKQFLLYFVPIALSSIIAYYNYKVAVFKGTIQMYRPKNEVSKGGN